MRLKPNRALRIIPNLVFRSLPDFQVLPPLFRVLHVSKKYNEVVLFSLSETRNITGQSGTHAKGRIFFSTISEFLANWDAGKIQRTDEFKVPTHLIRNEENIPEKYCLIRDRRWAFIDPLVSSPDRSGIFIQDLRHRLLLKAAKENGTTVAHLYDLLYRYWQYGQFKNSLLPDYPKSGGKTIIREPKLVKRGRPKNVVSIGHDLQKVGINISKIDRENIEAATDVYHIKSKRNLHDSYNLMLNSCYSKVVEVNGEISHENFPAHEAPTENQFLYWAKKFLNKFENRVRKLGPMRFAQKARARSGRVTDQTRVPTDTYEFDASVANVWLVSRFNRRRLVGKVVVYFVVDRATTMITGMHTALEGPSWNVARIALFQAMSNKVEYCARYGVDIRFEDWPCQEKPRQITSDFGEAMSKNALNALQNNLGIISNPNAYGRPDRKPVVESRFKFVLGNVEWVAGGYKGRAQKWRDDTGRDPRFDAVLDISEFTRILIGEVLDHNNNRRVPHLLTAEMRKDDVQPYRRDIYLWGLQNLVAQMPAIVDQSHLYIQLLPSRRASIQEKGLIFGGRRYLPTVSDHDDLLSDARRSRISVNVFYEPNFPHKIWVRRFEDGSLEEWHVSPGDVEKWINARLEEVEDELQIDRLRASDAVDSERQSQSTKIRESLAIEERAKQLQRATPPLPSKAARIRDIKAQRSREASLEHKQFNLDELTGKNSTISAGSNNKKIVDIDLMRKKRRENQLKRMKESND